MATRSLRNENALSATSLVREIHAASVSASKWPCVLERLRKHFDARVVTLGFHEFASGSDPVLLESPSDVDFGKNMANYSARNPWFLSSNDYVVGRVMTGDEIISQRDLCRTDFYREFLKPRGLLHRLCGVVAQRPLGAHLLSAYRAADQGAFGHHEKADLAVLLDHITLSLESHWRCQEADDFAGALLAQTDHDLSPFILITSERELIFRNRAAAQFLDRGAGLRLDGHQLVAASQVDQRLLRETVTSVVQDDPSQGEVSPSVVTLACAPSESPVVVVVRSAGQIFMRDAGVQRALVSVTIRGGRVIHDHVTCTFAQKYEFTNAQARVSSLIFSGHSLSTIAQSLNVSENTVRSHLRKIFEKTDTHSQMQLVHLHARICPVH